MTVELPNSIARRAEERAAELGIPLSQYVAQVLEDKLTKRPAASDSLMAGFGELRHLREETERIDRIIEEEFEQIELELWT